MACYSLNTWSLNRNLGPLRMTQWDEASQTQITVEQPRDETISLLELPAALQRLGYAAIEICHFNFPATDSVYLQQLKEACRQADISFHSLLIDYGDISSADPVRREADIAFIRRWIDIAAACGARHVRIVAGQSAPDDQAALARAVQALESLCAYAESVGVRPLTENFMQLAFTAQNCLYLRDQLQPKLGLTVDFGNFKLPNKYEELAKVLPYAEAIHAKANNDSAGQLDEAEFRRCLELAHAAGYSGPYTLVYGGTGDQWDGVRRTRSVAEQVLQR